MQAQMQLRHHHRPGGYRGLRTGVRILPVIIHPRMR